MGNVCLFIVICIFGSFMTDVVNRMIKDKCDVIRFIGYAIAIVGAVFVLWLVLFCFFQIDLLKVVL